MAEIEFPPGTPEEIKEFLKNKVAREEMQLEAARHDISRFFDELNPEQLRTLCAMFGMIGNKTALYYQGYVTALLMVRHNVCAGCGQDHDKMLLDEVTTIHNGPAPDILIGGIDSEGNRVDTCSTCHGDKMLKVCEHPLGSHGQGGRELCPEPTEVPCCECCCPSWYTKETLTNTHGNCGGTFLPLEKENQFICSTCGEQIEILEW